MPDTKNVRLSIILNAVKERETKKDNCVEEFKGVVDKKIRPAFRDACTQAQESGLFESVKIVNGGAGKISLEVTTKRSDETESTTHAHTYAARLTDDGCQVELSGPNGVIETIALVDVDTSNVQSAVSDFFESILGLDLNQPNRPASLS